MLYRHGLRSPLTDEIGARAYARQPWPRWAVPAGRLTPHGREGMRLLGVYDRQMFAAMGLWPGKGCPTAATVRFRSDSDRRTVSSGRELAEGLAPGCELPVRHRPTGVRDPLFSADAPGAAPFDPRRAVQSIVSDHGGPAALIAPYRSRIRQLQVILGCPAEGRGACDIADQPSALHATATGIHLTGPIAVTSGTAEVLLLEYAEGMPMQAVGWGRADPAALTRLSRLHALLFDVYDRPLYMAHRTAAAMAPRLRGLLGAGQAPKITIFIGHDNNIAALARLLGVDFTMPGYGRNDPPIGGALGFELLRDRRTSARYVRVFYQAQTLVQLRRLAPLSLASPPAMQWLSPHCAKAALDACTLSAFKAVLSWPGQRMSHALHGP